MGIRVVFVSPYCCDRLNGLCRPYASSQRSDVGGLVFLNCKYSLKSHACLCALVRESVARLIILAEVLFFRICLNT
jgi:hypothetical protein